jgi:hypothetical protein
MSKGHRHRSALSPSLTRVYRGEDDLSEWDDEELQRGKKRNARGGFSGPDPKLIPRHLYEELTRRKHQQAFGIVRDSLEDAVTLWGDIVRDPNADLALRLEASKEIANRILGKAVDRSQVDVTVQQAPYLRAIEVSIVATEDNLSGEHTAEVIDVVADEHIEWDDDGPGDDAAASGPSVLVGTKDGIVRAHGTAHDGGPGEGPHTS